jgi:hypothetical protein
LSSIEAPGVGADCAPSGTKITLSITCRKATVPDTTPCTGTFPTDAVSGGTVIVKVDYVHSWLTPAGYGATGGNSTITLSKTTEMRIE